MEEEIQSSVWLFWQLTSEIPLSCLVVCMAGKLSELYCTATGRDVARPFGFLALSLPRSLPFLAGKCLHVVFQLVGFCECDRVYLDIPFPCRTFATLLAEFGSLVLGLSLVLGAGPRSSPMSLVVLKDHASFILTC